jgi:molybdopterin-guanine dinucleotide biosynthesis protein A
MGTPKAWLDFGGEPLLVRTVRVVASVAAPVVVVASQGQDMPPLPTGIDVVRDAVSDMGPLAGLAAGLEVVAPRAEAAFVSATDAPFLHPALIRRLVELRGAHDVVAPRAKGGVHPLTAVYGVGSRAAIEASLAAKDLRVWALLERLRTLYVDEAMLLAGAELAAADPQLRSLINVNTPEQYRAALAELAVASRP